MLLTSSNSHTVSLLHALTSSCYGNSVNDVAIEREVEWKRVNLRGGGGGSEMPSEYVMRYKEGAAL